MKRLRILLVITMLAAAVPVLHCRFETAYGPTPYTVHQEPLYKTFVDSLEKNTSLTDSIKKANRIVDSLRKAYMALKFGMFPCFNMNTFERCCCPECASVAGEWGTANVPENLFNPTRLDCGQWVDAAKAAGCTYIVLTTKHHDGFCNWDSKYTDHDLGNAKCLWKRDIIKELTDSARSRGLKVGLYYSIWDKSNGSRTDFIKGQLAELLTNYSLGLG